MKNQRDEDRGQNFIRGSQIFFQNMRMFVEASHKIFFFGMILCFGLMAVFLLLWIPNLAYWYLFIKFYVAKASFGLSHKVIAQKLTVMYGSQTYHPTYGQFMSDPYVLGVVSSVWIAVVEAFFIGFITFIVATLISVKYFRKSGEDLSADKYIRGAKFTTNEGYLAASRLIKVSPIKIPAIQNSAKVFKTMDYRKAIVKMLPLPDNFEVQHALIHGTVGAGKSQLTLNLVSQIKNLPKKSKRIFVDVGCNIIPYLYNPQEDYILNPFDARSVFWDIWYEFETDTDFANLAAYLIPMPPAISDPFWINAPRTIVASAAYTMQDEKDRSVKKLLDHLFMSDISDLSEYLDESEARRVVSEKIAKTTTSILGVLAAYIRCLKYLVGTEAGGKEPFSIKKWVQDENATGTLFIAIPEDKREELKGLVTLWVSQAIDSVLALEENNQRRVYFICDEIGVMNKIEKLQTGMGLGRKYGLSFILGMQSSNQFVSKYGDTQAKELFDFMNTQFYFRSNEAETAQFASKNLGEEDVETSTLNRSYSGHHQDRQGVSMINQIATRPIAQYSEIQILRDLECYIKTTAGAGLPVTKIHLDLFHGKKLQQSQVVRKPEDYKAADKILENLENIDPEVLGLLMIEGIQVKKKGAKKLVKKEVVDSEVKDEGGKVLEEVITADGEILLKPNTAAPVGENADEVIEDVVDSEGVTDDFVEDDGSGEKSGQPKKDKNVKASKSIKSTKSSKKRKGKKIDQPNDLVINEKEEDLLGF